MTSIVHAGAQFLNNVLSPTQDSRYGTCRRAAMPHINALCCVAMCFDKRS